MVEIPKFNQLRYYFQVIPLFQELSTIYIHWSGKFSKREVKYSRDEDLATTDEILEERPVSAKGDADNKQFNITNVRKRRKASQEAQRAIYDCLQDNCSMIAFCFPWERHGEILTIQAEP